MVTVILNHNPTQVMSPTGSSTTRSLMNRRVLPALKPIRLPKLRMTSKVGMQPVLDDEQIRALLASPRYLTERVASAERSQVYHFEREGLMSSSSQSLNFISTGQFVALFSHQSRLNQDIFSKRS